MANIDLAEYDSRAVRAASKKLKSCAQALSSGTQSKLSGIKGELPQNLEGDAAQSLQQRMGDLSSDISTIIGGMNGLARALDKYADELDRTAARLRKMMSQS